MFFDAGVGADVDVALSQPALSVDDVLGPASRTEQLVAPKRNRQITLSQASLPNERACASSFRPSKAVVLATFVAASIILGRNTSSESQARELVAFSAQASIEEREIVSGHGVIEDAPSASAIINQLLRLDLGAYELQTALAYSELVDFDKEGDRHLLRVALWRHIIRLCGSKEHSNSRVAWAAIRRFASLTSSREAHRLGRLLRDDLPISTVQAAVQGVSAISARSPGAGLLRHQRLKNAVARIAISLSRKGPDQRTVDEDSLLLCTVVAMASLADERVLQVGRGFDGETRDILGSLIVASVSSIFIPGGTDQPTLFARRTEIVNDLIELLRPAQS